VCVAGLMTLSALENVLDLTFIIMDYSSVFYCTIIERVMIVASLSIEYLLINKPTRAEMTRRV
jgi:hypothetical protein